MTKALKTNKLRYRNMDFVFRREYFFRFTEFVDCYVGQKDGQGIFISSLPIDCTVMGKNNKKMDPHKAHSFQEWSK